MIVANWKCNGSKAMINEWTNNFLTNYAEMNKAFIGIAPPSIYIESILDTKLSKLKEINIGSQDIDISSGARTGAISSEMILDFDCKFSIIGHSERRQFFNENNHEIKQKILKIANKTVTILCVGETLNEKEENKTFEVIKKQLSILPHKIQGKNLDIAYEPVWAIGTGLVASKQHIEDVLSYINNLIKELYYDEDRPNIRLFYGGSVDENSVEELSSISLLDGFLIGSASADFDKFKNMLNKMR